MFIEANCMAIVRDLYGHTRGIREALYQVMEHRYRSGSCGIIYISIRPAVNIQFYLKIATYVY